MFHTHFAGVDDRYGPESLEEIKGIELYRLHALQKEVVVLISVCGHLSCITWL